MGNLSIYSDNAPKPIGLEYSIFNLTENLEKRGVETAMKKIFPPFRIPSFLIYIYKCGVLMYRESGALSPKNGFN